jgi:hypothetical protein
VADPLAGAQLVADGDAPGQVDVVEGDRVAVAEVDREPAVGGVDPAGRRRRRGRGPAARLSPSTRRRSKEYLYCQPSSQRLL